MPYCIFADTQCCAILYWCRPARPTLLNSAQDGKENSHGTTLVVREQGAQRLAVVGAPDGLGDDLRDVQDIELLAQLGPVLVLRHAVGGDELVDAAVPDPVGGISAQYAVRDEGVDLGGALLLEQLGSADDLRYS